MGASHSLVGYLIMGKMNGDRVVLIGYIFIILTVIALDIIAFIEKNLAIFMFWIILLFLILFVPIALLKFLSKILMKRNNLAKIRPIANKLHLNKPLDSFIKLNSKLKKEELRKKKLKQMGKLANQLKKNLNPKIYPENKMIKIFQKKPEEKAAAPPKPKNHLLEVIELNKIKNVAETKASTVKTDFDAIIDYIKSQKEVNIGNLATHFKMPREKIDEWVKVLADHGLIEITYPTFGDAKVKIKLDDKNE